MNSIEVVAAIIVKDCKILITKRVGGQFDGLWEFPGGKIEESETHEIALIREINEELEIKISIDKFLNTIEYNYDTFHLIMHLYFCTIVEGSIKLKEHSDGKWISLREKENINWVPADVQVLDLISSSRFLCK
ncbi:MAG: (deoxy)nucleoside triphosphate pyrophosphohydrolase [Erysipelotrichaceae bacterium]|nr:(deoxy)nucleoside triphosphate pyrophosphohydrolase [Erysipelotrichaceae bacterium]